MYFVKQIIKGKHMLIQFDGTESYGGWCHKCGKEYALTDLEYESIIERGDLYNSNMYCAECSKGRESSKVVKFPQK